MTVSDKLEIIEKLLTEIKQEIEQEPPIPYPYYSPPWWNEKALWKTPSNTCNAITITSCNSRE